MSQPNEPDETIPREKVKQLVENLRSSADELLDQLACDEIRVEPLLEVTRFMARSARRISRRAHWPMGEPAVGNEAGRGRQPPPERGEKRRGPDRKTGPVGGGRGRGGPRKGPRGGGRSTGRR